MGITDELEALRQSGRVKAKSATLSTQVSKHGFTSPETEAEQFKRKSLDEKQSRLEAQNAMHKGGQGASMNDLNMLYKKLITDQREKKREAEKNLREWRKQHVGKGGGGEEPMPMPTKADDEEESMNVEALEMLPEHVVSALKEKYETDNAALALSRALNDESEHGKGELATLMDVGSPRASVDGEITSVKAPYDETTSSVYDAKTLDEDLPAVEEAVITEEEKMEEKKEPDEQENEPNNKAVEEETKQEPVDEVVEEVREELEQLSIDEDKPDKQINETKEEPPTTPKPKPDLSSIPNIERINQTKRFYNTHSQEYIDNISSRLALTPTSHRDAFITHVHLQQHLNTNDPTTMIDLGCGFGRDALHFSSLGHYVLGVDYSVKMLNHAKKIAPKAHYLNMDMRSLKNVLVDESVDGVWANASLVHLPKCDVLDVLKGLYEAVKVGGVLYLSLRIGNADDNGEVFEADERYTVNENVPSLEEDNGHVCDDTRRKLYSYYTIEEVKELMANAGWDVMEMGKDDQRERGDYAKHTMYVFATRRN
mmetsp:Transcript_120/g.232  ORF Transcript_120/g.232 Transcript_120/m.232 type:complete len:541 (-) Transcript_120:379-2001(-)